MAGSLPPDARGDEHSGAALFGRYGRAAILLRRLNELGKSVSEIPTTGDDGPKWPGDPWRTFDIRVILRCLLDAVRRRDATLFEQTALLIRNANAAKKAIDTEPPGDLSQPVEPVYYVLAQFKHALEYLISILEHLPAPSDFRGVENPHHDLLTEIVRSRPSETPEIRLALDVLDQPIREALISGKRPKVAIPPLRISELLRLFPNRLRGQLDPRQIARKARAVGLPLHHQGRPPNRKP